MTADERELIPLDDACDTNDCRRCTARHASPFAEVHVDDMAGVSAEKGCRLYRKGEMLYYSGDQPSGLYCIHHGNVKIFKMGRDGKEQIVRLAHEGDILGYRSLISGEPYSSFAVPIDDAQICHIPKHVFFNLITTNSDFSKRIMVLLSRELKAAEERIVEIAHKPVRERLAETLLLLHQTYGTEADRRTLGIKLTRVELANIIGTTSESVSRALSAFREMNIIEMNGRKIGIVNHNALLSEAHLDD